MQSDLRQNNRDRNQTSTEEGQSNSNVQQILPSLPVPPYRFPSRTSSAGPLWNRRRGVATSAFRRNIYRQNLYVEADSIVDITGRVRDCSADWYRNNQGTKQIFQLIQKFVYRIMVICSMHDSKAYIFLKILAQTHRLVPWLNRELNALMETQPHQVPYVLQMILDLIQRFNIRSPEFSEQMVPYTGTRTNHFQHEFYNYARSTYDMIGYDRHAMYSEHQAGTLQPVETYIVSSESSSSSSDDENDINVDASPINETGALNIGSNDSELIVVEDQAVSNVNNDATTGAVEPVASTSHRQSADINTSFPLIISSGESDANISPNDDVEIVNYVKPRKDRTPVIVNIESSDEDINKEEKQRSFEKKSKNCTIPSSNICSGPIDATFPAVVDLGDSSTDTDAKETNPVENTDTPLWQRNFESCFPRILDDAESSKKAGRSSRSKKHEITSSTKSRKRKSSPITSSDSDGSRSQIRSKFSQRCLGSSKVRKRSKARTSSGKRIATFETTSTSSDSSSVNEDDGGWFPKASKENEANSKSQSKSSLKGKGKGKGKSSQIKKKNRDEKNKRKERNYSNAKCRSKGYLQIKDSQTITNSSSSSNSDSEDRPLVQKKKHDATRQLLVNTTKENDNRSSSSDKSDFRLESDTESKRNRAPKNTTKNIFDSDTSLDNLPDFKTKWRNAEERLKNDQISDNDRHCGSRKIHTKKTKKHRILKCDNTSSDENASCRLSCTSRKSAKRVRSPVLKTDEDNEQGKRIGNTSNLKSAMKNDSNDSKSSSDSSIEVQVASNENARYSEDLRLRLNEKRTQSNKKGKSKKSKEHLSITENIVDKVVIPERIVITSTLSNEKCENISERTVVVHPSPSRDVIQYDYNEKHL